MKLRPILTSFVLCLSALSAWAVPARPGAFNYTQPDGSVVRLERHGDEFFSWTTLAGTSQVVELAADGFWRAASISLSARQEGAQRRKMANRGRVNGPHYAHNNNPMTHGERHIPVLLVAFSDLNFKLSSPNQKFDALLNQNGYSENGGTGSVQDYYVDNSNGHFKPVFDVYGPVKLDKQMSYYGKKVGSKNDEHPEIALYDACKALDSQIDFSQYDYDNDGEVDMVLFYYAGYNQAEGGPDDSIWPHQWTLQSSPDATARSARFDGKKIGRYFCTSELKDANGVNMCGIGTTCHEFGHSLGLPDFYDTDYEENGTCSALFSFSTMCGGSYNNESHTPPYFNAEERVLLGWMLPEDILPLPEGKTSIPSVKGDIGYKSLTDTEGEYFVYEYRDGTGWDKPLPKGLLVYHADKSTARSVGGLSPYEQWAHWESYNTINAYGDHPCFYIVPAADPSNLLYKGSLSSVIFPGTNKVTSYSPVDWEGNETGLSIAGIDLSAGTSVSLNAHFSMSRKLTGKVTTQDGSPIAGALITLSTGGSNASAPRKVSSRHKAPGTSNPEALSDSDGSFILYLDGIEENTVHITVSKEGFHTLGQDVQLGERSTQVQLKLVKYGEGALQEYAYYDPRAEFMVVGNEEGVNSQMASIRIPAADLPASGGRLTQVRFVPLWDADAYYIIVDSGTERLLTYRIPDSASMEMRRLNSFDLTSLNLQIPAGEDLYVGYGVENAHPSSGYEGYLFYICEGADNLHLLSLDKERSNWGKSEGYCLICAASIIANNPDDPYTPPTEPSSFGEMGFTAIADPGNGSYASGSDFQLSLEVPADVTPVSVSWTFDGQAYSDGTVITLHNGSHTVGAQVEYADGSREKLLLILNVK